MRISFICSCSTLKIHFLFLVLVAKQQICRKIFSISSLNTKLEEKHSCSSLHGPSHAYRQVAKAIFGVIYLLAILPDTDGYIANYSWRTSSPCPLPPQSGHLKALKGNRGRKSSFKLTVTGSRRCKEMETRNTFQMRVREVEEMHCYQVKVNEVQLVYHNITHLPNLAAH